MDIQKLISLREGYRRVISIQIEKFNGDISQGDSAMLIEVIQQKAEIIKGLNEEIINHPDTEDVVTELVESDEYSINLHLKIIHLEDSVNSSTPPTTDLTPAQQTSKNTESEMEVSRKSGDSISIKLLKDNFEGPNSGSLDILEVPVDSNRGFLRQPDVSGEQGTVGEKGTEGPTEPSGRLELQLQRNYREQTGHDESTGPQELGGIGGLPGPSERPGSTRNTGSPRHMSCTGSPNSQELRGETGSPDESRRKKPKDRDVQHAEKGFMGGVGPGGSGGYPRHDGVTGTLRSPGIHKTKLPQQMPGTPEEKQCVKTMQGVIEECELLGHRKREGKREQAGASKLEEFQRVAGDRSLPEYPELPDLGGENRTEVESGTTRMPAPGPNGLPSTLGPPDGLSRSFKMTLHDSPGGWSSFNIWSGGAMEWCELSDLRLNTGRRQGQ